MITHLDYSGDQDTTSNDVVSESEIQQKQSFFIPFNWAFHDLLQFVVTDSVPVSTTASYASIEDVEYYTGSFHALSLDGETSALPSATDYEDEQLESLPSEPLEEDYGFFVDLDV